MIYPTPSKEFDGVTTGLKLLETAVDLIALCEDQPERKAEYLQEAANLINDARMAVQTAAGRAIEAEIEAKENEGFRKCIRCKHWKPEAETVRLCVSPGAKDETKRSHWRECRACLGLPALQTNHDDDLDPFESDDR